MQAGSLNLAKEIIVMGPVIRTTNQQSTSGKRRSALWQRVMFGEVLQVLRQSDESDVYTVYFDYESDHRGELSQKFPGGIANLERRLTSEGHAVRQRKRYFVVDHQRKLVSSC